MHLAFSPQAATDLEEIGDHIAQDNPARAVSFLDEIQTHCRRVAEMPESYLLREDLAPGLRMAIHGNYLILFRFVENAIRIERIVHGARKQKNLL